MNYEPLTTRPRDFDTVLKNRWLYLARKTASSSAWQEFEQTTFLLLATGEVWFVNLQLKKSSFAIFSGWDASAHLGMS